jgi:hypothetical protein
LKLGRTQLTVLLILVVGFAVYRVSPRGQVYDSRYTLAVASQLAATGSPRLDELATGLSPGAVTAAQAVADDYRLVEIGKHVHYLYPPGTPFLAVPWVVGMGWLGQDVVDAHGRYQPDIDRRGQRILAALWTAALAAILFLAARTLLAPGPSLWITLAAALGSPLWSTASRSLWTHTAATLLQGAVVLVLLRSARTDRPPPPVLLGTLLAWGFFCRPTGAIPALAVALWVMVEYRQRLPVLLATGGAWAAAFFAWSASTYGHVLPPYYQPGLHVFAIMPGALLGNLVSPARGLLVYSPWIAALGVGATLYGPRLAHRSLALLAGAVIGLHWLFVSSHAPWWAGWGFGPRLMTDVIPWIVLIAIEVVHVAPTPRPTARALLVGLLGVSVALHGVGAFSRGAVEWNDGQEEAEFEDRLWDWADPPFLRVSARRPRGGP